MHGIEIILAFILFLCVVAGFLGSFRLPSFKLESISYSPKTPKHPKSPSTLSSKSTRSDGSEFNPQNGDGDGDEVFHIDQSCEFCF